jgi:excisionase family DNA binding protein
MAIPTEWFTLDEASEYMRVSKRTIYKWCKEGRLATYRLSQERTRRFRREDLDRVPKLIETRGREEGEEALTPLTAIGDPVLAELWNNERDAAYDAL